MRVADVEVHISGVERIEVERVARGSGLERGAAGRVVGHQRKWRKWLPTLP
jgi:hypothetical protein